MIAIISASLFDEATSLIDQKEYKGACDVCMQGIFTGRKIVQQIMENQNEEEDDPRLAMDWIVQSYLACGKARIELEDWNTARSDAWAACTYSQNENIETLECMLNVCENTNDTLGELQTLKLILEILEGDTTLKEQSSMTLQDVQDRISALDDKLEEMYKR